MPSFSVFICEIKQEDNTMEKYINISYWGFVLGLLLKYCTSLPDALIYSSLALIVWVFGNMLYGMMDYY